jgi:hypothetical protein
MIGRGRLKFDAIMGKEMMGTFYFEFDSTRWGERIPAGASAQRNYSGFWGVADRSSLELKNMFLTFGMPWIPVPTTIQAGIHPLYIRPGVFCATDGPGITAAIKIDPATIKLAYFKALEGYDWAADDDNVYAIEANVKVQTLTIGGYWSMFNWNSYPAAAEVTGGQPLYSSNVWWGGVYVDGKAGPMNLSFDFIYDKGNIKDRRDLAAQAADVKISGWAAVLDVGFPWEKFLFGIRGVYGSGADQKKSAAKPLPNGLNDTPWGTNSTKVGAFLVPGGTEGSNAQISLIIDSAGIDRNSTGFLPACDYHGRSGFGGLWAAKIYGGFQVSPEFSTRLEATYIGDTTKNGNTIGNALTTAGTPRDDKVVGMEVDWYNKLAIYKNLTFEFGGGYLFAKKGLDYAVIGAANGTNKSPKDPWLITTRLMYAF